MAIDFPDSPSINDTFTAGGKVYQWDGVAWEIYGPNVSPNTFKIDDLNNRVGINQLTPTVALDVTGDISSTASITAGTNITASGTLTVSNGGVIDNGLAIDDVFLVDSVNSRVGVNDTSPAVALAVTGDTAITGNLSAGGTIGGTMLTPYEKWNVTASAPAVGSDENVDLVTSSAWYYTSDTTGDFVVNFRGSASVALNDLLETGEAVTASLLITNGGTAYYLTAVKVDGASVTPEWQNGAAPTAGNTNSIDVYTFTVLKTGASAFTVLGSNTRFA